MDDRDAVAELLGLAHDVSREDDGLALVAELADHLLHLDGVEHVESDRRLVEDQDRRIVRHRPCDRDLLLHSRRELVDPGGGIARDAEAIDQLFEPVQRHALRGTG